MNKLLTVLAFAILIRKSVTQNGSVGNCTVDDGGAINWSIGLFVKVDAINDVDGLNLRYNFTGNLEVETTNNQDNGAPYIEVITEGSELVFKTNEYFLSNFEEDQRSQYPQNSITIRRTVTLRCEGAHTIITFSQPVIDTNNNKPTFKSPSYNYILPSPLVPKLDLSGVGDAITVEDLDFSNKNVTFNVEPSGAFTVETASTDDRRTYRGILKVTEYTFFSSQTTLTVTATDNGNPALTSDPITITIDVDSANSIPNPPTFSEAVYKFEYSDASGTPTVTSSDDKTIVITSTEPENITVHTDNSDFKAKYDPSSATVTIEYTGTGIESTLESVLVVTLTATLNHNEAESSKTAIFVDIPSDLVDITPRFNRAYYTATYNSSTSPHTVTLDQDITVTEDATVNLQNASENFEIVNSDGKWTVNVLQELPQKDLVEGTEYVMILEATIPEQDDVESGYSTLIITPTPVLVPTFAKSYYTATYKIDNDIATVEVSNGPVEINIGSSQADEISVTFEGDYAQNFDIEFDNASNSYSVSVASKLDQDVLSQGDDIILTINAVTEYSTVSTLLVITLPKIEAPKFSEAYYTAWYVVNDDFVTLTLSSHISVTSSQDQEITVDFAEANENFLVEKVAHNTWVVALKENVSDDDLEEHDLIFSLEATVPGSDVGRSTLIIHLQSKCTNVF